MEDGVVASINRISSVDIRTDQVAFTLIVAESISLVCRSVSPQYSLLVDVVRISTIPSDVIQWEA